MSSTNLDTPQLRLIVTVISAVVILHVITAMALAMVNTPKPTIKPIEVMPPIEIQLPPPPVEIEKIKIEEIKELEPEPITESNTQPKAKPVTAKPRVVEKPKTNDKPKAAAKKETVNDNKKVIKPNNKMAEDKPTVSRQPVEKQSVPIKKVDTITTDAKRERDIADAKRERDIADAKREKDIADAKREKDIADAKREKDIADAKREKDIADAKREKDIANAKKLADKKQANFEVTAAHWAVTPDFNSFDFSQYNFRSNSVSVVLSMSVSSNGAISNIKVKKSSGDNKFDRALTRKLAQGRLNPFDSNGSSVEGTATLPLKYNIN